jgi:hypothetical protein
VKIQRDDWGRASGSLVIDGNAQLWRIVGFIDQPAVILDPVRIEGQDDKRQRDTVIMGCVNSEDLTWLEGSAKRRGTK